MKLRATDGHAVPAEGTVDIYFKNGKVHSNLSIYDRTEQYVVVGTEEDRAVFTLQPLDVTILDIVWEES